MEIHRDGARSGPFASSLGTLGAFESHHRAIWINEVALKRVREISVNVNWDET